MAVTVITGSAGLIGSEASKFFADLGFEVAGIDNDMRQVFFGEEASTKAMGERLQQELGRRYTHYDFDIRQHDDIDSVFRRYKSDISLVIQAAAQPSHDWAAREPFTDSTVNANGTLNLLEAARRHAPSAVFIFMSTNKVYGDSPNRLPLVEQEYRWEIDDQHPYSRGIPEAMSIDQSLHSLFGASKTAGDLLVQAGQPRDGDGDFDCRSREDHRPAHRAHRRGQMGHHQAGRAATTVARRVPIRGGVRLRSCDAVGGGRAPHHRVVADPQRVGLTR
jgi:CDP-paratose 2-epimerase